MKQFVRNTVIFALPVMFIAVCFEILLRKIPNDYAYKKKYLDSNSRKIEILFLGNSHAYYGIDPKYIQNNSYNAAYISQSLKYDLAILRKYQEKWDSLKCIVIPLDYFSLYSTLESGVESWRTKNYSIYYGIHVSNNIPDNTELFTNPLMVTLSRISAYYYKHMKVMDCSLSGWGTTLKSVNNQDLASTGIVAAKRHTEPTAQYFSGNMEIVKSIIDFARSRNIQIIFFTSPASRSYVKNLNKDQLNTTVSSAALLAKSYNRAGYYNLLNDKDFTNGDFFDGDHLNEIGTKKLTMKIYSLIKQ